jgi:hypothetical protein
VTTVPTPRDILRGIAAGRRDGALAVPLALHVAARIQERDPEDFLFDATQLANALRDLADAVEPDGVVVSDSAALLAEAGSVEALLKGDMLACALEATRRLRASYAERLVLTASLPGPAGLGARYQISPESAAEALLGLGKEFLSAGADLLLVQDDQATELPLNTLANVARFHQALALSHGASSPGLPAPAAHALDAPVPSTGVVITPAQLPRTTDIALLRDWVEVVRSAPGFSGD